MDKIIVMHYRHAFKDLIGNNLQVVLWKSAGVLRAFVEVTKETMLHGEKYCVYVFKPAVELNEVRTMFLL